MVITMTTQFAASSESKRTKPGLIDTSANASVGIFIRSRWQIIVALGLSLLSCQLHGQRILQISERTSRDTQTASTLASLPKTTEEIDGAIVQAEIRLRDVRLKVTAPKTTETAALSALAATSDELAEREQLLQQWEIALSRYAGH